MSYPSNNLQHIVICPKWRKPIFEFKLHANACEQLIRHICELHNIQIEALAVQPDHVHIMVRLPNTCSLAYALQQIKWFSSIHLRRIFPALKRSKALWAVHYFAKSVGGGRAAQKAYIDRQMANLR